MVTHGIHLRPDGGGVVLSRNDRGLDQLNSSDRLFGEHRQHDRQAMRKQGDDHMQVEFKIGLKPIGPVLEGLTKMRPAADNVFLPVQEFADGLANEVCFSDVFVLLVVADVHGVEVSWRRCAARFWLLA